MLTFRCMKCGNNLEFETAEGIECNSCGKGTIMILLTEENKNSLPFPTNPINRKEVDFNDPSKTCQCAPGICPCGKFVSHLATESWDPDNPHIFGTEYEKYNKEKNQI